MSANKDSCVMLVQGKATQEKSSVDPDQFILEQAGVG